MTQEGPIATLQRSRQLQRFSFQLTTALRRLTMENLTKNLPQIIGPRTATGLAVLAGYLVLVRKLRNLRRHRKHAEYPYKTREDFSKMTAEDACAIVVYCMTLEFPFTSEKALQFALFKYGLVHLTSVVTTYADIDVGRTVYRPSRNCCARRNSS